MRVFSMMAGVFLSLYSAAAHAEPAGSFASDDAELSDEAVEASSELRVAGYNIWFCSAVRRSPFGAQGPLYFGASAPFLQGSGQGQAAKAGALQQAVQACGGSCVSGCYVKSFRL